MSKPGLRFENESDRVVGNEKATKLVDEHEKEKKCVKDGSGCNREILKRRKPRQAINLPYGCVWSDNEHRVAIRIAPFKNKNGL